MAGFNFEDSGRGPGPKGGQVAGLWGLETARPRILSAGLWEGTPPAGALIVAPRD